MCLVNVNKYDSDSDSDSVTPSLVYQYYSQRLSQKYIQFQLKLEQSKFTRGRAHAKISSVAVQRLVGLNIDNSGRVPARGAGPVYRPWKYLFCCI